MASEKGGLAGVHMGKDAQNDLLVNISIRFSYNSKIHIYCSTDGEKKNLVFWLYSTESLFSF